MHGEIARRIRRICRARAGAYAKLALKRRKRVPLPRRRFTASP